MNKELVSKGINLQDLSSFIEESKRISAPLRDMVQLHRDRVARAKVLEAIDS
ncbi:MAG TPA: hypothetical protein VJ574_01040 [Candidatus Bathyarchaeia archaeon]|nr:hypothetical protein [Candidatus Bathyarchaeia archaeon]